MFCLFGLVLTLNLLSYIIDSSFYPVLSVRQKVPKNSARGKNLHKHPLLASHDASPRSGTCSPLQAFACLQGAAERTACGNF